MPSRPERKKRLKGFSTEKAVIRVSCFVSRENLEGRGPGGSFFSSRRGPDGCRWFFVPSNGVLTLNLNRLPAEKKTEGLQYQQVPIVPREWPCFVSRVSCFVKTLEFALACAARQANPCLGSRVS